MCRCVYWCIWEYVCSFWWIACQKPPGALPMADWNIYSPVTFAGFGLTFEKLSANVLTLLTQTILSEAKGLVVWFPFPSYYQSKCSRSHHCFHIVCNCHVRGGAVTVAGRSMPPSTPTSSQLLWPWCFSSMSDCSVHTSDSYMSTLMVPSCLQEVRHSVSSLSHLYITHTDTYTLPPAQCCHLSPIISSFHFFWWGGADLAGVLCDNHNHFNVSFILLSVSILISV